MDSMGPKELNKTTSDQVAFISCLSLHHRSLDMLRMQHDLAVVEIKR